MFHRRGSIPTLSAAFSNDGIDATDDPLQFARTAVRTSYLDLLLRVLYEQFRQPLTLLADEFIYRQALSSFLLAPRS